MTASGARQRGPWYEAADLGCFGLGIGLVAASVRLFSDAAALLALALVALTAWALASALRRTRLPGWSADAIHLVVGTWLLLAIAAPMSRFGPFPTLGSLPEVGDAIRADFGRFDEDVAPLVAGTGHLVVVSTLLWVLALFNSTSAMRLRAPVQGVVPHVVAFVGLGFVAREQGRAAASVAMLAALAFYTLTQVAWRNATTPWVPNPRVVPRRSFAVGAGILAAAAVVTAVVAPVLPGGADPVVDLRRGGLGDQGPRTVVSPFVEVGANLGPRSEDLLFTFEAPEPQYWRLTALETYEADKGIWVLSNSYEPVDGELVEGAEADGRARLDVRGLGGIWVPAPGAPVTAEADFGLNWDPDARSLVRRSGDLLEGDAVDFGTSAGQIGTPGAAAGAETLRSAVPAQRGGELVDPAGAPAELVQLARDMGVRNTPYDTLLALQDHFRSTFTYDETIDLSGAADPLGAFLEGGRGFCQQFSTAFALGARSLGYPARVVVGFTAGDPIEGGTPDTTVFAVRGRHAHAWPEVYFDRIGWVPFEPTPGRGNPATTAITGVPGGQAAAPEGEPVPEDLTTSSSTPAGPQEGEDAVPTSAPGVEGVDPAGYTTPDDSPDGARRWPVALAVAAALVAAVAAVLLRRRRRSRPRGGRDPVADLWRTTVQQMADRGLTMSASDTPVEFAHRCDDTLEAPAILRLAGLETARRWSARPTEETDAAHAREAYAAIVARLTELDSQGDGREQLADAVSR